MNKTIDTLQALGMNFTAENFLCITSNKTTTKAYLLVEFAKLHVRLALEAAAAKAIAKENPSDYGTGEIWVDEESILNSYPENLIQ